MPLTPEYLSVIVAIATSLVGSIGAYGAMRSRVDRLEKDLDKLGDGFVANDVFRLHVSKIEQDLTDLKKDVRLLLMHVMSDRKRDEGT